MKSIHQIKESANSLIWIVVASLFSSCTAIGFYRYSAPVGGVIYSNNSIMPRVGNCYTNSKNTIWQVNEDSISMAVELETDYENMRFSIRSPFVLIPFIPLPKKAEKVFCRFHTNRIDYISYYQSSHVYNKKSTSIEKMRTDSVIPYLTYNDSAFKFRPAIPFLNEQDYLKGRTGSKSVQPGWYNKPDTRYYEFEYKDEFESTNRVIIASYVNFEPSTSYHISRLESRYKWVVKTSAQEKISFDQSDIYLTLPSGEKIYPAMLIFYSPYNGKINNSITANVQEFFKQDFPMPVALDGTQILYFDIVFYNKISPKNNYFLHLPDIHTKNHLMPEKNIEYQKRVGSFFEWYQLSQLSMEP